MDDCAAPERLGAPPMEISMNLIQQLEKEQFDKLAASKEIPDFAPGDTVIVNVKVVEGERTRVQAYEGVCIGRSGRGINESFTVRKISYGEGVERVFPLLSPMIDSIKLVRRGKVRRAKLYYLRGLRGKSARISEGAHHGGQTADVDARKEQQSCVRAASGERKGRLVRPFSVLAAFSDLLSRRHRVAISRTCPKCPKHVGS